MQKPFDAVSGDYYQANCPAIFDDKSPRFIIYRFIYQSSKTQLTFALHPFRVFNYQRSYGCKRVMRYFNLKQMLVSPKIIIKILIEFDCNKNWNGKANVFK